MLRPGKNQIDIRGEIQLTAAELEAATSQDRELGVSVEQLLLDDYKLKPVDIGSAISRFFGVPYEPFRPDRVKPLDLLRNLKKDYVQQAQWLPLEENPDRKSVV